MPHQFSEAAMNESRAFAEKGNPGAGLLQRSLAAFERENILGAGINWLLRPERPPGVVGYNPFEDPLLKDVITQYPRAFVGSNSPRESELIKMQIFYEQKNDRILNARGGGGFWLQMAAGVISPENFIPIGAGISVARTGNRILAGAKAGITVGAAGGALSEALLQSVQTTRSWNESMANVGFGALLGGVLGSSAAGLSEGAIKALEAIDGRTINRIDGEIVRGTSDITDGIMAQARTRLEAEGGFSSSDPTRLVKILEDLVPESSVAELNMLSRNVLKLASSPLARMTTSSNPVVRTIGRLLFKDPIPFKNPDGSPGVPIESQVDNMIADHFLLRSDLIEIHDKAVKAGTTTMDPVAWKKAVRESMSTGRFADASVEEAFTRTRVFMDNAEEVLKDTGFLPWNLEVKFAEFYFPRKYDPVAVEANRADLHKALTDSFIEGRGLSAEDAAIRADQTIGNMLGDMTGGLAIGRRSGDGTSFVVEREVPLTDEQLLGLGVLDTDLDRVLESFSTRMLSRALVAQATNPAMSRVLRGFRERMGRLRENLDDPKAAEELIAIHEELHYSKAGVIFAHSGRSEVVARIDELDDLIETLTRNRQAQAADPEIAKVQAALVEDTLEKLDALVKKARNIDREGADLIGLKAEYQRPRMKVTEEPDNLFEGIAIEERAAERADLQQRVQELEGETVDPDNLFRAVEIEDLRSRIAEIDAETAARGKVATKKKRVNKEVTEELLGDELIRKRFFDDMQDAVFVVDRANAEATSSMRHLANRAIIAFDEEIAKLDKTKKKDAKKIKSLVKEKANFEKDFATVQQRLYHESGVPQDPTSLAFRATGLLRTTNFVRLGGGFAISSIPDMGMQVFVNGLGTFMKTLTAVMQNPALFRLSKDQRSLIAVEMAGNRAMTIAELNNNAYTAIPDDFLGPFEAFGDIAAKGRTFPTNRRFPGSRIFGTARGETPSMAKLTFLSHWNAYGSAFASLSASHNLIDMAVRFANGTTVNAKRLKKAREMGFTDADLRAVADQYGRYGGSQGRLKLSGADTWDNHAIRQKFSDAIRNDVRNTVLTVGIGNLPRLADGPIARMLFQFRSFSIAATQAVTVPALSKPDQSMMAGILAAIGWGAVVEMIKAGESGRRELDPANLLRNAVDRSGTLGLLTEVDNISEKLVGWGPIGSVLGTGPASRFQSRNMLDALFGASVGTITDTTRLVHDTANLGFDQGTLNTARRLAPYQNLVWLRWAFDQVQENLDAMLPERAE